MTAPTETIRIPAHSAQLDFIHETDHPYIGFLGGRGSGKTKGCALRLFKFAMEAPGLYGMYAPTYSLLQDSIQRVFLALAKEEIEEHSISRNIILMSSGAEILCRSLDDPEHARGPSLRGAVWDEASLSKIEAFNILIASLRYEGKQGWLACGFTPKGPNHWTATVFGDCQRQDVICFHATTWQNPFNPPGFADALRRQYTSAFARQEIEGQFVSLSGGLFNRSWFEIIPAAPAGVQRICRAWDLAATTPRPGADPDYTVGAKIGWLDGTWYIMDIRRGQTSPQETERIVRQTAVLDGRDCWVRMEQEGGASGKSLVDHYGRNVLSGYSFAGVHPTGDKQTRAMPFAAAAEAGNVKLVAGAWNKDFLDELESFAPDCKHDDQTDASSLAFETIAKTISNFSVIAGNQHVIITRQFNELHEMFDKMTPEEKIEADRIMREQGVNL